MTMTIDVSFVPFQERQPINVPVQLPDGGKFYLFRVIQMGLEGVKKAGYKKQIGDVEVTLCGCTVPESLWEKTPVWKPGTLNIAEIKPPEHSRERQIVHV